MPEIIHLWFETWRMVLMGVVKQTKTIAWVGLFCLQPREVVFLVFRAKGNVIHCVCIYGDNPVFGFYAI